MLQLDKDGTMIDPDRSMDEIERVMREFMYFANFLKETSKEEQALSEEEKEVAKINCNGALIVAENYLEMKRSFFICKDDPLLSKQASIKA